MRRAALAGRLRALLLIALVATCFPSPANAHEELALHSLTVLGSVSPEMDGVELRIVHLGAPAFALHNPTSIPVQVLDERGRAFLEVGPKGVRADVSSDLFYSSVVPGTHDRLSPRRRGPRWVNFSSEPRWTWFDPRLEPGSSSSGWSAAFRYGDSPVEATGSFEPLEHHGHFFAKLEMPELTDLDVRLVQGPVPVVYVRNDRDELLEVRGIADEPFLRIGPDGVSANVMSPTYYSAGGLTIRRVPAWADAAGAPRWKKVSDQPVWAWLEYRAAVAPELQQRDLLGARERVVHGWTSPMTLDGEPLGVQGTVTWVPPAPHPVASSQESRSVLPRAALGAIAALALIAAVVLLVRRPRAQPI